MRYFHDKAKETVYAQAPPLVSRKYGRKRANGEMGNVEGWSIGAATASMSASTGPTTAPNRSYFGATRDTEETALAAFQMHHLLGPSKSMLEIDEGEYDLLRAKYAATFKSRGRP